MSGGFGRKPGPHLTLESWSPRGDFRTKSGGTWKNGDSDASGGRAFGETLNGVTWSRPAASSTSDLTTPLLGRSAPAPLTFLMLRTPHTPPQALCPCCSHHPVGRKSRRTQEGGQECQARELALQGLRRPLTSRDRAAVQGLDLPRVLGAQAQKVIN